MIFQLRSILIICLSLMWAISAQASTPTQTADLSKLDDPHAVIKATTSQVMDIISEAQGYYDNDPDRFYSEIQTTLGKVVDFNSFARGVMGKYASSKRYKSLKTAAEKQALKDQVKRFSTVFQDGLVQTYAKGLLAFKGEKIEVLPADDKYKSADGSVTVIQHIHGDGEKPYVVHYKMKKNKKGAWKLRNVTIEAINLGKVYQSQFYSAVQQYGGDINKVIDNWTVDPTSGQEASAEPS